MNIYWQSFVTFFKIGMFTLGGGYAMIPIIESEVVDKNKWVSKEEFLDLIAIAQSCPGVFAINISVFIGYKLRKVRGAVVTALGTALPSFFIILLIAMFFHRFQDNPVVEAIFKGIRPAVASLIAVPMINMAIKGNHTWWAWAISATTLVAVAFLKFSPIYILLVLMVLALAVTLYRERRGKEGRR